MPTTHATTVYEIAEAQNGYFTMQQASAAGLRPNAIVKMAQRGVIERVSQGVYRVVRFPPFLHGQLMEATLWPFGGTRGVISHASALRFHELSDISPNRVHITVPRQHRVRRAAPAYLVVHYADLAETDVEILDGVSVTTPSRSIRDSHTAHAGPALIRQAIGDGRRTGKLSTREADALTEELLKPHSPRV